MKIDWLVMGKAIGLMLLSWGALPLIYFILLRRKKEKNGEEEPRRENDQSKSEGSIC